MKNLFMTTVLVSLLLGGPLWIIAGDADLDDDDRERLCGPDAMTSLDWSQWFGRMVDCLSDGDKLTLIQYPALAALFRDRLFGLHSLPRDFAAVTHALSGVQTNLEQVVSRLSALERK